MAGELKSAFQALRTHNDKYKTMKKKLLNWYEDSKEYCTQTNKAAFNHAKKHSDESLRLYAARLERLFKLAHPKRNSENSKVLRDKFLDSIPSRYRKQLQSIMGFSKTMAGETLSWKKVVTFVSHIDTQIDTDRNTEEDEQVLLYAAQEIPSQTSAIKPNTRMNKCDAISQCSLPMEKYADRSQWYKNNGGPTRYWSPQASPEDKFCSFCGRVGHDFGKCRRRLGLCLVCGSGDHRVVDCPDRTNSWGPDTRTGAKPKVKYEPLPGQQRVHFYPPDGEAAGPNRRPGNYNAST